MVKKYSKRTYKRKNKISRKRKSKRNHSRYKKKKTKKKKRVKNMEDNLKAGMKSGLVPPSPDSLEPEPASADPETDEKTLILLDTLKTKQTILHKQAGQVKKLNSYLKMPQDDKLTITRVNHNSLDSIKGKILESGCDTVYVLVISNHGTMLHDPVGSPSVPGRRNGLSVPQNSAIVFNILPGESDLGGGDPDTEIRYHRAEGLILKVLSDNIENYGDLDDLFERDGCLSKSGEKLNSDLTKIDHYIYDNLGGIHTTPEGKPSAMISEIGGSEKQYGILNKLQVYKQGENYSNLSFDSSRDLDKNKLGLLFKFKKDGNFIYYYFNFLDGGYEFSDSGVIRLSNILAYIDSLLIKETGKNFIITYRACRIDPSELQRTSSAEHGNSDSIDCYIKKFLPIQQTRIKQTIIDLGYENMNDFYKYLKDKEYLDAFVKLEEKGGEIIGFFRDLATEEGKTDRWLDLANKERIIHSLVRRRRLHSPLLAATLLPTSPSTQQENPFFVGEPPEPEPEPEK